VYGQLYPIYHKDSIDNWLGNRILFYVLRSGDKYTAFADNKKWELYRDTLPYTPLPNVDVLYKITGVNDTTFESYERYIKLYYEMGYNKKICEFISIIENVSLPEMMRFDAISLFSRYMSGYRELNEGEHSKKDSIIFYPNDPIILNNYILKWMTGERNLIFSGYYLMKVENIYTEINQDYKYSVNRVELLRMLLQRNDLNEEDKRYIKGRLSSFSNDCNSKINSLENNIEQLKLIINQLE
ncbi:MAG: hypothetical protein GX660_28575, partial [Clostridiaceae bacterium]|nr:hypothetical protein [Clostridiaceae bacterium]